MVKQKSYKFLQYSDEICNKVREVVSNFKEKLDSNNDKKETKMDEESIQRTTQVLDKWRLKYNKTEEPDHMDLEENINFKWNLTPKEVIVVFEELS